MRRTKVRVELGRGRRYAWVTLDDETARAREQYLRDTDIQLSQLLREAVEGEFERDPVTGAWRTWDGERWVPGLPWWLQEGDWDAA